VRGALGELWGGSCVLCVVARGSISVLRFATARRVRRVFVGTTCGSSTGIRGGNWPPGRACSETSLIPVLDHGYTHKQCESTLLATTQGSRPVISAFRSGDEYITHARTHTHRLPAPCHNPGHTRCPCSCTPHQACGAALFGPVCQEK